MKNRNYLERVITETQLSVIEQKAWRLRLRSLSALKGIESLCLDDKELFVEYNPVEFNPEDIITELMKIGFPIQDLALVQSHQH